MKTLSEHQKGILALILANIIWGAASPIFKLSLQNIPPFSLAFFRFFYASIILLPFVYREFFDLTNEIKNWKPILFFSLSGITINIIFFFLALKQSESINAPIISSVAPILVMMIAIKWLGEKLTPAKLIGAIISITGVFLIIIKPLIEHGMNGSTLGNFFMLIATLGSVIHIIIGRFLAHKYPPLPLTFLAFLIGAISFAPFALLEIPNFPPLDIRGLFGIFYGAIFASTIAYAFQTWGLSKIEASEVSLFIYIDPVIAILLAYPLLGERPTPLFTLGAFLIFAGIGITERRLHWHPLQLLRKRV